MDENAELRGALRFAITTIKKLRQNPEYDPSRAIAKLELLRRKYSAKAKGEPQPIKENKN